jgi:hypothetical protein
MNLEPPLIANLAEPRPPGGSLPEEDSAHDDVPHPANVVRSLLQDLL